MRRLPGIALGEPPRNAATEARSEHLTRRFRHGLGRQGAGWLPERRDVAGSHQSGSGPEQRMTRSSGLPRWPFESCPPRVGERGLFAPALLVARPALTGFVPQLLPSPDCRWQSVSVNPPLDRLAVALLSVTKSGAEMADPVIY